MVVLAQRAVEADIEELITIADELRAKNDWSKLDLTVSRCLPLRKRPLRNQRPSGEIPGREARTREAQRRRCVGRLRARGRVEH